ncbi:MAG: hypothetical protein HKN90_09925 [Flavobacteriaceae bacterium]|nr:hypothetical protein [Flavobacteriaceae bacterium]
MKIKFSLLLFLISIFVSCQSNNSIKKNLITGITTIGDGLSCSTVFLSDETNKIERTTFTYGERFYLNFDNITGFIKKNDYVFPGMRLTITDKAGDTLLFKNDMYEKNTSGFNLSPLLLRANIITGAPIHSKKEYNANVYIWDKIGKGTYNAKMKFKVIANDKLSIINEGVSYDELYLFSLEENAAIIDGEIKFDQTIYCMIEGLNGFKVENQKVAIGLKMIITDANGMVILNEEDLVGDMVINSLELTKQLAPKFTISPSNIKNPLTCEIMVWDKRSSNKLSISTRLNIK